MIDFLVELFVELLPVFVVGLLTYSVLKAFTHLMFFL